MDKGEQERDELRRIAEAFPPKPKCCSLEAAMAEHERAMREEVIPQIERDLKAQAIAAHYLRLGIPQPESSNEQ